MDDEAYKKLEARIKALEDKIKGDETSLDIFGKAFRNVGSSRSDLLLRTRGGVKIQYGNVFVDLFKDGKIAVDTKVIYSRDKVGVKDGIYLLPDGKVVLKIGLNQITLSGEIGTTYVSFMAEQDTTSDLKYTALRNVGFILDSLSDFDESCLQNGIVYVEDEQKLYVIVDGTVSEYKITIPNPFTELFVIKKNNTSVGSLLITGDGKYNSLAFDSLYIYVEDDDTYIDSDGTVHITVNGTEIFNGSAATCIFSGNVVTPCVMSRNATEDSGFRLYLSGGESTLEVDNLIIRNQTDNIPEMLPMRISYMNNVILDADDSDEESDTEELITLTLAYKNQYKEGDLLLAFLRYGEDDVDSDDADEYYQYLLVPLTVESVSEEDNSIDVAINTDLMSEADLDIIDELNDYIESLINQRITAIYIGLTTPILVQSDNNISLYNIIDYIGTNELQIRIGDLNETGYDSGVGIYSRTAVFNNARMLDEIPDDEDSDKIATTEWVKRIIQNN